MAYIVPYRNKHKIDDNGNPITEGQFQLGYKGLIELCQRSGQFKSIINEPVYEGQLIKKNKFTGEYVFDEDAKTSDTVIDYMAYFKLINGFEKTSYMTKEEILKHATRFSQSYRSKSGIWNDDFDSMAKKTVLKLLINKYAPKSIEMQQATIFDQAVVKGDLTNEEDIDNADIEYPDNTNSPEAKKEMMQEAIDEAQIVEEEPKTGKKKKEKEGGELFNGDK